MSAPQVGDVHNGYSYLGGDPSSQASWKPTALTSPATLQFGPLDTGIQMPDALSRLVEGTGRGMVNVGHHIGNLVGAVSDQDLKDAATTDKPLLNTTPGAIGNFVGETAATLPLTMGASEALGAAGALGSRLASGPITNGIFQGGLQGAVMADPGSRTKGALFGGIAGGALPVAGAVAGKLMRGATRTPAAQLLLDRGVDLTPGQMNPEGAMNQIEQAAGSVPVVGQIIKNARNSAEQGFQQAVVRQGAAPGATIQNSSDLRSMLDDAYKSFQPLYDQAKGFPIKPAIMNHGADVPLSVALEQSTKLPGAPSSVKAQTLEFLKDQLTRLGKNPHSDDLLDLRSAIRAKARDMALKTDSAAGAASDIYNRAQAAITKSLESQLPSDALTALQTADSGYGTYKIIENAVAKSKDNLAGLTPAKLSQAVYDSIPDGAYAKGAGGPLRDLAQAGGQVFQTVSPATGARVATLGGAGAAALLAPHYAAPVGAAYLAALGTQTGRRLAAGRTAPQLLAQALTNKAQSTIDPRILQLTSELAKRGLTTAALERSPALLAAPQ